MFNFSVILFVTIIVFENVYGDVNMSVTISVRVKKEVKEELEKAGINVSEIVRKHLEELAWKIKVKREIEELRKILEKVKPSPKGFAVKSVREDRDAYH